MDCSRLQKIEEFFERKNGNSARLVKIQLRLLTVNRARGNGGRNKYISTASDRYRSRNEEVVPRLRDERDHRARAARRARRVEAGAAPHPGSDERPWPGLQPRLPQVRQDLRRHFRQLSPAR